MASRFHVGHAASERSASGTVTGKPAWRPLAADGGPWPVDGCPSPGRASTWEDAAAARSTPEDADALLAARAADAAYLKTKPGFISTQLYRGIAGSGVFVNQAVWESVKAFRNAFGDPQFQATFARYPDSTVASPHLFQKLAVPGICVDR